MKYFVVIAFVAACSGGSGGPATDAGSSDASQADAPPVVTPDPSHSSLETDRDTVAVTDAVHLTFIGRDAQGNPIAGASVELTADGNGNTFSAAPLTDAAGMTTVTWTSTVAETKTVTATVNGVAIATHTVAFMPGPAAQLGFTQQPSDAIAGAPIAPAIAVEAEDMFGNFVPSATGYVHVSLATNPGSTSLRGVTFAELTGGIASFDATHIDVAAMGYTLTAEMEGLANGTSAAFDILPGTPDMVESSITAAPTSLEVGESTVLTVQIANSYGAAIANALVTLSVTGSNNTVTPIMGATDSQGTMVASLSSTTAEVKTVTAQTASIAVSTQVHFYPPGCRPLLPGLPWTALAANANALQVADVDNDGYLDVIISEPYDRVAVHRGRGDGGFFASDDLLLTAKPIAAIAVGDFNGDNYADLAISEDTNNTIEIALGSGNGQFAVTSSITFTTRTGLVVTGDFNNDNHVDLATMLPYQQQVAIELGTGTGTFTSGPVISNIESFDLKAVDLDVDGDLDLLTSEPADLTSLLGRGDGTFDPPAHTPVGANGALFVGDFNNDTTPDVAIGSSLGFLVSYLGQRNGQFQQIGTSVRTTDYGSAAAVSAHGAGVADLDADGDLDIVLTAGSTLSVLHGAGDGTFVLGATYTGGFGWAALVDVTGDGVEDVVGLSSRVVGVVAGTPGGGFVAPRVYPGPSGQIFGTAADFDGNGLLDLVRWESSRIRIVLSQPDGTLADAPSSAGTQVPYDAVAGDVTGDGIPDVVAVNGAVTGVTLNTAIGNSDGSLPAFTSQSVLSPYVTNLELARLDQDNKQDLVLTRDGSMGIWIATSQGNGQFSTPQQISTSAKWAHVADISGDGIDDVITSSADFSSLVVHRGNGQGGVVPPVSFLTHGYGGKALTGDVDGDGIVDVVMLHEDSSSHVFSIAVMRGLGAGALAAPIVTPNIALPAGFSLLDLALVDLSSDGELDLVVHSFQAVTIFEGYGDGYFRRKSFHYMLGYASSGTTSTPALVISDHDQNQSPDIALFKGMGIGIALNQGCSPP